MIYALSPGVCRVVGTSVGHDENRGKYDKSIRLAITSKYKQHRMKKKKERKHNSGISEVKKN